MTYHHDDVLMLEGDPGGHEDSISAARSTRTIDRYSRASAPVCNQQFKPGYLAAAKARIRVGSFRVASGSAERAARLYLREWRRRYRRRGGAVS